MLEQPQVDDEVESSDDDALKGDGARQASGPSRRRRLDERRQDHEHRDADHRLGEQELHRFLVVDGSGQVHRPLGQDQRAPEHDGVAHHRGPAEGEAATEEDDDTGVGDDDAGEPSEREPVAGNQEVGEDDRVDRVEIQDDGGVGGGRHCRGEVHAAHLHRQE